MKKNVVKSIKMNTVDPDTGEITGYLEKVEVHAIPTEPFFLTYSKEIMALYNKSVFNATTKVLWKLLEMADYNTGTVYMNSDRRTAIMQECSISRPSFDRAIKELIEVDIMQKEGKSSFRIKETMFWKGDRKTRERLMKEAQLKISFEPIFPEESEVS